MAVKPNAAFIKSLFETDIPTLLGNDEKLISRIKWDPKKKQTINHNTTHPTSSVVGDGKTKPRVHVQTSGSRTSKSMDDLVREAQQAKSDHVIKTNSKNVKYAVQPTRSERTAYNANRALNGVNVKGNWFSRIGATASTLFGSAVTNLSKEGALGHAGKQVVKSAAVGAGFQGGLAALQGDDPWEAAKKGAFQGAMVGAGYQGLKAATHANASSIRGNLKHMGSTVADTYRAHSSAGQTYMRQNGVSDQLKRVLDANRMSRVNEAANKLNKPKKKR